MILHIISRDDWANARSGVGVSADGFVHCSDFGTAHLPANAVFAGRTDLLLLVIDPARVGAPVKWEAGVPEHPAGVWFPHVYGTIPVDAVVAVHDFPPGADGVFRLPEAVANL
ncbi:hypothetical protein Lesp02_47830 [Lentzea sp. NBRC 105346]|uniref:DUF952 domain-containing protein n=1 Tax=Lentzea sp. NBRC 105346 TaxID=3032205 RepID=UPI0024A152E6|nr:DUF952 domain-containing protein [Lentzea sp. NBRC 105346]GLZ32595.1 hypothetical protein Lesp02_47830 [Lentzea sp. NBRC 105346]